MREPSFGRRAAGLGRRLLLLAIVAVVAVAGAVTLWAGFTAPTARLAAPIDVVGRATPLSVTVDSGRSGLRTFRVELQGEKGSTVLAEEEFPRDGLLGSGVTSRTIETVLDARTAGLAEGPATLVVRARDWSPLGSLRGESVVLERPVRVDLTPPTIAVLGTQHYLTRGGSDAVAYTVGDDAVRSGVEIGEYFFPGDAGLLAEANGRFAIYAMPQDLEATARPKVMAEDAAGNRREVTFPVTVKDKTFPAEEIRLDDQFLTVKIPDLLAQNELTPAADPVQSYLLVNRDLRKKSEQRIQEITRTSEPRLLIDGAFRQQPGSKVGSRFAERRTYRYNGEVIDTQVHLGYDLASVKLAPVNASNAGKVVFVGNLGIYGNAVLIDHGLGLSSLYAHLSSASVTQGQEVTKGEEIGRTGDTGLAGGDHLHFSILLRGHHIDPVEWWDPKWLQNRILAQMTAAAPSGATAPGTPPAPAAPPAAPAPVAPGGARAPANAPAASAAPHAGAPG
jgi:murein DD-endopeptidase MepM/ murein hydrolase activator NlpD